MKKTRRPNLVVSREAITDFGKLTVKDRLWWLDEMRTFLSAALSPRTKRIYEMLRRGEG